MSSPSPPRPQRAARRRQEGNVIEVTGNIWDFHKQGKWIAITTNGVVNQSGANPMGRGIALQAKKKYPRLPAELGKRIMSGGSRVYVFPEYRIITFPVKYHWRDQANLELIERSASQIRGLMISPIYLVRPGCGAGQLDWAEVKPRLEHYLDDGFTVVEIPAAEAGAKGNR